jgi:hypothetical protein
MPSQFISFVPKLYKSEQGSSILIGYHCSRSSGLGSNVMVSDVVSPFLQTGVAFEDIVGVE